MKSAQNKTVDFAVTKNKDFLGTYIFDHEPDSSRIGVTGVEPKLQENRSQKVVLPRSSPTNLLCMGPV